MAICGGPKRRLRGCYIPRKEGANIQSHNIICKKVCTIKLWLKTWTMKVQLFPRQMPAVNVTLLYWIGKNCYACAYVPKKWAWCKIIIQ